MSVIPEGYFEAQAIFSTPAAGGPAMVVTGHTQNELSSPDEEAELVAENCWGADGSLISVMSSSYALIQVNVYANQGGPDLLVGQWNGQIAGDGSGAAAPQVAVLVQKQSPFAGRRNRGRMYVPGVQQNSVGADGDLDGTSLSGWQAAAETFLAETQSHGVDLVILHNEPAVTPTIVTGLSVQALTATQRRRVR